MMQNGTAYAGRFYTSTSAVVMFQPGETAKSMEVPIAQDLGDAALKVECA